jgi:hypothetical protein
VGLLQSNFIQGSVIGQNSATITSQYGYNCIITNNIFYGYIQTITNSAINNNILPYWVYTTGLLNNLNGCTITNNIIDARSTAFNTTINFVNGAGLGNNISNNICLGPAALPSGNGNISNTSGTTTSTTDPTNTFLVANPWTTYNTEDSKFQLKIGSNAIGIGSGGIDAGAFGGTGPYVLNGLANIPQITSFSSSAVGNSTTPLNVTVTVRGNN